MPALDFIDHSPQQPEAAPSLTHASNLILIDNYDSFTWNIYQYLVLEGATVTVHRNDKVTVRELIAANPTQLVISPGPGHPETDSGVSRDAIKHFAGKIPILGVCMGQQCMISLYGGEVSFAGEILHGKTSPLQHDGKGVYTQLPQDLPVTRYHSLAGTYLSLPECLEVSSWIGKGSEKGVIQGVRHREFTLEGVQFHPESILSAQGRVMLRNFLNTYGGTWAENDKAQKQAMSVESGSVDGKTSRDGELNRPKGAEAKKENILHKIFAHRKAAVAAQKLLPGLRPEDLQAALELNVAPPQIDFVARLRESPYTLSLMAEIKRASPSKGIISMSTCAPAQARTYALAGASVISVLTEPEWFKGSIDDLRHARQALVGMNNRPALLRKEFIFDEYQILEARLNGADTVLLIVKMLDEDTLIRLYRYSISLGMEPLVEVNTPEEMAIAVKLGSKVIGVNNRNLASFEVDLDTTSRLMEQVPQDTIVCALSGISGSKDVEAYQKNGVGAVLVGEALMRAKDTAKFIAELLDGDKPQAKTATTPQKLLVKICGTRTTEAALQALRSGADLIGMILVPGRKRTVTREQGLAISKTVREYNREKEMCSSSIVASKITGTDYFAQGRATLSSHRPLLVGVFQNQPLSEILELQKLYELDVVQLHGQEPLEWCTQIPVPVIKSFKPDQGKFEIGKRGYHTLPLLDSPVGGTGEKLDMNEVRSLLEKDSELRILLAGGLDASNVREAFLEAGEYASRIVGVDVASGIEIEGRQDLEQIDKFVKEVRTI